MKKIMNSTHLEGYVFSHSLEVKISGPQSKTPGVEFIAGTLDIATDDAGLNVVPVTFRYVTAKFKSGKDNGTFKTLFNLIKNPGSTWQDVGADAVKIKVDTALGLNDFYAQDGELVTYKINDGGFAHVISTFSESRNQFDVDMLITGTFLKEADADRDTPEMLIIKGATFNFMGSLLPIELTVKSVAGIKHFESYDATPSKPVFVKVWGHIVCTTIDTQTVEESAFGEPSVKISQRKFREWEVTGVSPDAYDYGDESILTFDEVATAQQTRETYLADVKKRHDEYMASKSGAPKGGNAVVAAAPVATETKVPFKF